MADDPTVFRRRPSVPTEVTPPISAEVDAATQFKRKSVFPQDPVREEQSKMSWPAYAGQATMDAIAGVNKAFYGGMAPRIVAGARTLTGGYPSYDEGVSQELAQQAAREYRSPWASKGGQVAGGVAQAVTGARVLPIGATLSSRFAGAAPAAVAGPRTALERVVSQARSQAPGAAGYAVEGGLYGAANAAGHTYSGNPADYATAAAKGALPGAILGAAGGAMVPRSAVTPRPGDPRTGQPIVPPTLEEQRTIIRRGYDLLENNTAQYSRAEFNRLLGTAERQMANQGALPATAAGPHAVLERLRNGGYAGGSAVVTPREITLARQALTGMRNTTATGARDGIGANTLRDTLDDFLQNPGRAVVANHADALRAGQIAGPLRREYASMARSRDMVEEANNARMVEATGGPQARGRLQATGREMLTEEGGRFPNLQGHTAAERGMIAEAITPNPLGASAGRTLQMVPGFERAGRRLEGFSGRGIQRRWDEAAQTLRERAPAYERATQGAVPVPGPGMSLPGQAAQGGTRELLVTPPDDGRDAVAWSYMKELMQ